MKILLINHIQKLIVNNFEAGQKKCQLLKFKIIQKSSYPPGFLAGLAGVCSCLGLMFG